MDLTGLLRDVIEELEPSVRGRAVDWTVGALPVVRGDRTVLHLVLVILLSTA